MPLTSLNECTLFLKNKIGGADHLKCMHSGAWFKTSLEPICLRPCFVYFIFSLSQSRRRRILTIRRSLRGTSGAAMGEETPLLNAKKTTSTVGFVFMFIFFLTSDWFMKILDLISILRICMAIIVQYLFFVFKAKYIL